MDDLAVALLWVATLSMAAAFVVELLPPWSAAARHQAMRRWLDEQRLGR